MPATSSLRPSSRTTNGSRSQPELMGGMAPGRRSAPMVVVGLAAVVVGALVFLGAHMGLDDRQEVLVVARPVAAGQVIAAEDLRVANVALSSGADSVPAGKRNQIVGKPAAVGLLPGGVLSPAQVGAASGLGAGEAIVGVPLKAGQAPSGLRTGTRVQVVDTGGTAAESAPTVVSARAVVADIEPSATGSGVTVVSLRVPGADAVAVAAAGAAGRVSLVVLPAS